MGRAKLIQSDQINLAHKAQPGWVALARLGSKTPGPLSNALTLHEQARSRSSSLSIPLSAPVMSPALLLLWPSPTLFGAA
jgi:hypothetical protein